jgi:hypothetical protein
VVKSFLDGIAQGALQIGSFILRVLAAPFTFWLSTNSPPRFLPDIDTWGLGTALEFLAGFASAPLSAIVDFGSNVAAKLTEVFSPSNISSAFTSVKDTIASVFSSSGDGDVGFFSSITDSIDTAKAKVNELASSFAFDTSSIPGVTAITSLLDKISSFTGVDIANPFTDWTFTEAVQGVISFITNPIGTVISPFTNWLLPEGVADVVNLVIGTVTSVFNPLGVWTLPAKLNQVFNIISGAEKVGNFFEDFSLSESLTGVFDFISQPIPNPFADFTLPDTITSFFDTLSGGVSVGLSSLGEGTSSLVDTVSGPLSDVNETIPELFSELTTSVISFFTNDFFPIVGETLAGLGTVLSAGVTTVATEWDLSEIIRTITRFFVSSGITTVTVVANFFGQVLKAFVDGIAFLVTEVDYVEILTSFSTFVTNTLIPSVLGFGKEVGLGLVQGVLDAFGVDSESLFAQISSSITSAFAPIKEFFDNVSARLETFKDSLTFLNVIPGVNIGDAEVEGGESVLADIQRQIDDAVIQTNPELTRS